MGINYSNNVFKRLSFSFDNSPVLINYYYLKMSSIILGWLSFKNAKNFSSNFGISEVTTLSKNPLTPA